MTTPKPLHACMQLRSPLCAHPRSFQFSTDVLKRDPGHLCKKASVCTYMAHVTPQREGTTAAPTQQQPSRDTENPSRRQEVTRALLLPVDDTDESERACLWAASNMYRKGDTLHLLHVVPEPSMVHVWPGMYVPPDDDAEQDEVNDAVRMIRKRFTSHLKTSKIPCQVHVAVAGTETDHLAKLINEKAEEVDAACIVMASHGKTSFQVRRRRKSMVY